ncbi:substrate-binding domain-containing protein [Cohnella sp. JJ-181]|uniref:substrate-binding domain-containing protein n=1 Tax=Cohnella rhizoplanae TaxID=2974897 RepID=UPI0022FFA438|nr:substrate-binding domain-containing protein [Cohnella sp. JJ-181]CAI6083631.1 HTH-type transcriptional regulator DegA [Cohnella sp. JJ-181]
MGDKVSMQRIADELGISKNAVSLALGGRPGVSGPLRDRIFETANRLGYRARADKEGRRTRNLLVLIPKYIRHDQGFYREIYWAIDRRAKETGCTAVLCEITEGMEEADRLPEEWYQAVCEGLLLIGVFRESYVRHLLDLGAPLVIVDHEYDTLKMDAVVTANTTEAYRIVSYLIGLGHRRIGFIGAIGMTRSFMERWLGYCQAMSEAGLAIPEAYCLTGAAPLATLHSQPSEVQAWLEGLDGYPTAWFCANDRIAVNLIEMLSAMGVRIPEALSVAGFDDIEEAARSVPPLTTVQVQREQLGYEAVDFLIRKIDYGGNPTKLSIYGAFIERASCARVGGET